MHRFKWKDRLIRRCSNMRIFFKLFKFLIGYPFLFGLLTSVVINYGDWWLVNFKYILYEDDSLIHIKRRPTFPVFNVEDLEDPRVPTLDYNPDDYDPERVATNEPSDKKFAKISPGDDGIMVLQMSSVDTFDNSLLRPRFLADELNMKKRTCVALIATSHQTLHTLSHFMSETLKNYVDKVVIFTESPNSFPVKTNLSNLVAFDPAKNSSQLPLRVLNYLATKLISDYEVFFVAYDNLYVNPFRLKDFTDAISVDDDLYVGSNLESEPTFCDLQSGIFISDNILKYFKDNIEWCTKHAVINVQSESENFGRCIRKGLPRVCTSSIIGARYEAKKIIPGFKMDSVEHSVVAYPVHNLSLLRSLHTNAIEAEIRRSFLQQTSLEKEILEISEQQRPSSLLSSRGRFFSKPWPSGSNSLTKPKDRFDRDLWTRFNSTHFQPVREEIMSSNLSPESSKDVSEIISFAIDHVHNSGQMNFIFRRFHMGWWRLDFNRGSDYLLLLEFANPTDLEKPSYKFVHVFRELSQPQNLVNSKGIGIPFVLESRSVSIIIPVKFGKADLARKLLSRFARTCLDEPPARGTHLIFVHTYSENYDSALKGLDNDLLKLQERRDQKSNPSWSISSFTLYPGSDDDVFSTMDFLMKQEKLAASTLVLFGTVDMEFKLDFLNRVRLNTIAGRQIFCPIPYVAYHPKLLQWLNKSFTKSSAAKMSGFFDDNNDDFVSFFVQDYTKALKVAENDRDSLCRFLGNSSPEMIALRAPEPSLTTFYDDKVCNSQNLKCQKRIAKSIGSRVQQGKVLISWEEKQAVNANNN